MIAGQMFQLAGAEVVLRPSGALWLSAARTLVVADLHFEKGSAYAARGQLLPPYDTGETLNRLTREIDALSAETVVMLGDTLHDMGALERIAPAERDRINALADRLRLIWICGNHDPDGAGDLGGETAATHETEGLILRHDPSPEPMMGEVAGHLHPCARLHGRAGVVRRRCFVSDGRRMILPAFGAYTGGLNLRDSAFDDLFAAPPVAFLLGQKITPVAYARLSPDR